MTRASARLKKKSKAQGSSSKVDEIIDMTAEASGGETEVHSSGGEEGAEVESPTGGKKVEEADEDFGVPDIEDPEFKFAGEGVGIEGIHTPVVGPEMTDSKWAPNKWSTSVKAKHIEQMRIKFSVPDSVTMRAAEPGEIPGRPREGEVAWCRSFFLAGVRLPLHPLFRKFLTFCGAAPLQINPNVWKAMISCIILWRKYFDADIDLSELVACFSLKEIGNNDGVYYANSWNKILCNPVDAKVWKNNWFFVGGDWERPANDEFPQTKVHRTFHLVASWLNPLKRLKKASQKRFAVIRSLSMVERSPKSLITEESLVSYALVVPSRSRKRYDRVSAKVEVPGLTPEKRKAPTPASSARKSKSAKRVPASSAPDAERFSPDSPPSVKVKHAAPIPSGLGKGKTSGGTSSSLKISGEEEATVKVPARVARLASKVGGLMPTSASSSKVHLSDPLKHANDSLGTMLLAANEGLKMRDQIEILLKHSSRHQSECSTVKGKLAVVEGKLKTSETANKELRSEIARLKGGLEVAEKTCQELRDAKENAELQYKKSAAYKEERQRLLKEGFINCRTLVVAEIGGQIGLDFLFPDERGKEIEVEVEASASSVGTEETEEEEEEYLDEDEAGKAGTPSGSEQAESPTSPPPPVDPAE